MIGRLEHIADAERFERQAVFRILFRGSMIMKKKSEVNPQKWTHRRRFQTKRMRPCNVIGCRASSCASRDGRI
jgi:hypothetical protein